MSMSAPSAELTSNWKFFIPLGHGKKAIVDEVDVMFLLNLCSWSLTSAGYPNGRPRGSSQPVLMHRVLAERIGLSLFKDIDHINRDPLDNRRCNLRSASRSQNNANSVKTWAESKMRGVYKNGSGYMSRICVKGQDIYLGSFDTAEKASEAYKLAAVKYYGEFANG